MREVDMRRAANTVLRGEVRKNVNAQYDFSDHGGAIGTIALGSHIPAHATVVKIVTVEKTAIAGTGTIQFLAGAVALTGALAVSDFTGVDFQTLSADGVKVAAKSEINFKIASNTITAGHVDIFIEYLEGNPAD